jgi:hypothetical protein
MLLRPKDGIIYGPVQLYTLDRAWPSRELSPLGPDALHAIAATLQKANCEATVYLRT